MNEHELILCSILNVARTDLYLSEAVLNESQAQELARIHEKRRQGMPVQYILGKAFFRDLELKVCSGVFIPRPETEILVQTALEIMKGHPVSSVLDIGTGSGCIAISVAYAFDNISVDATDISGFSLEVARENALNLGVAGRVRFINADLFPSSVRYDLVLSNPPYIKRNEIARLQKEVRYEPVIALDGGEEGLDFYARIIGSLPGYLNSGGFLFMEIGYDQYARVNSMLCNSGFFDKIEFIKDYAGINRVAACKMKGCL